MVSASGHAPAITFQGQDPRERFQFYFRQHWIRLLKHFAVMLLETAFLLVFGIIMFVVADVERTTGGHITLLLLLGAFLISQWTFLCRFYRYFLYIIVATDRKVHRIKKTLFTVDDHESIDLWMLQDICKHQHGIIQNLLGFGSLILEGQDSTIRIHFTPHIGRKYEAFMRLRQIATEGIETIGRWEGMKRIAPGREKYEEEEDKHILSSP